MFEALHDRAVGRRCTETVADASSEFCRAGTTRRNDDGRGILGKGVQAGVLNGVVAAMVAPVSPLPQQANHLDRLLQHAGPHLPFRPSVSQDVLIESLARADAEEEAPRHHRRGGPGRLGNDRRMDPHRRARDDGAQAKSLGRLSDAADDRPDEGGVALAANPGMEVVGDEPEPKSCLLR